MTRWAVLAGLAAFAVAPIVGLLAHADANGLVWTGADSPFPADEYQYLAWVRQFSEHLLAANTLDVVPSRHVFFHPLFFVSGIGVRIGLGPEVAYLLWKPVAVLAAFLGVWAYVARFLAGSRARLLALLVGLFAISPFVALVDWGSLLGGQTRAELGAAATIPSPALLSWGYLPTVIAIGLMPVFLLAVERLLREPSDWLRPGLVATACGAAASWLHPWKGEVLLVTLVLAVAVNRVGWSELKRLILPAAGLVAPFLYYLVLSRVDADWELAQKANVVAGHPRAWALAVAFLPFLLPAAFGVRLRTVDIGERLLQLWPPAALIVFLALSPSFAQHAFEGVVIPLGILAVRGVCRAPRGLAWAAALTALFVVPACIHAAKLISDTAAANVQPYYLEPGERDALDYLDSSPAEGAVLPAPFLSSLVPARTGRKTWLGHPSWTRDYDKRLAEATALFDGTLPATNAAALVRGSRARFVLADCRHRATADRVLAPLAASVRRFGCAAVYEVRL